MRLYTFFDKLEDKVRISLSHRPIIYSFVGAIGIVLVWKGVWETAEFFPSLHGPGSFILGAIILLLSGLMVSFFIGDNIIISGFKREKKLVEKTEMEVRHEATQLHAINTKLDRLSQDVHEIKEELRDS